MVKSNRVIAYIDGFNLYFGLKDKGWRCYYWLNVRLLCQKLLYKHQRLITVKYFTSRITSPPDKKKRQSTYIEALNTIDDIKIFYGKYQLTSWQCKKCGHTDDIAEEKMTDVQIATEMVGDAFLNNYDTAFLISGDRDLVPIVEKIRSECPDKRVIAIFPPMRTNEDLRGVAHGVLHITEDILKTSLFPKRVPKGSGFILQCPKSWN
jgi:uncharacterized LabA/DUF88 family protein